MPIALRHFVAVLLPLIDQPSLSAALTHAGHHDDRVRFFDGTIQWGL